MESPLMDWDEATTLGGSAARLIEQITLLFERISADGYIVTPPTWKITEGIQVRSEHTRRFAIIELDGRLRIAKVIEPEPIDGPIQMIPPSQGPVEVEALDPAWRAILDPLTCDACRRRHGMTQANVTVQVFRGCNSPGGCRCVVPGRPPRPNSNRAGG